jgi:hypothetical protein
MPKNRKLRKATQIEALSLLEYLLAEVFESNEEKHYRLKVPYHNAELVVDLSVYFDGELVDDSTSTKFRISGPNKKRH